MNYLTSGDPSKAPEIDIEEDHTMKEAAYQLIVAIANQGYTDKVMEAARSAGARGGTIVHTRSTGAEDAGICDIRAVCAVVSARAKNFVSHV